MPDDTGSHSADHLTRETQPTVTSGIRGKKLMNDTFTDRDLHRTFDRENLDKDGTLCDSSSLPCTIIFLVE